MAHNVTGLGGLFFRAQDPDALNAWYKTHFGIQNVQTDGMPWQQDAGFTVFSAFPKATDYFPSDRQFMINFRVKDLDQMMASLAAAGIEVETKPDEWDNPDIGRFARVIDPEGNPIELWEPAN